MNGRVGGFPAGSSPTSAAARAALESAESIASDVPWLADQIRADAAGNRFARWARCTVADRHAVSPVVPRALFDELHGLAGLEAEWPIGNAGLIHLYGYLLSSTVTSHGSKRDRWLRGGVASALGVPSDSFLPWFEGAGPGSTPLERLHRAVEGVLSDPGIDRAASGAPAVILVVEESSASLVARTTIVRSQADGPAALVYELVAPRPAAPTAPVVASGTFGLVTVFPVDGFDARWVEARLSEPPRLRYNAVDEMGVASAPLVDQRILLRRD